MTDDPLRMYLVLRRGAVASLPRAAELGGAAAVACVRAFAGDPALEAWRERPGKVCLRARTEAQWRAVLEEPHGLAGDPGGESAVALPPRRRSERGPLLERLQAMSTALEPPPEAAEPVAGAVTYLLNPAAPMSSGKTIAQVAHAAVLAAERLPDWAAAGCPAQVLAPSPARFAAAAANAIAEVVDAGLTEVPPGTVTVMALPPQRGQILQSSSGARLQDLTPVVLPEWPPGTVAVLATTGPDGPHAIPVSTALRAGPRTVLLALGRRRGSLERLRARPRCALTLIAPGVALTAHGSAAEAGEAAGTVAIRLDVDEVQDHLRPQFAIEGGVDWHWTDAEAEDRDVAVRDALRRLAAGHD